MNDLPKRDFYAKDAKGNMRVWSIWTEGDYLHTESGLVDGDKVDNNEPVFHGAGGRTKEEQLISRVNSRINKKIDSGHCESLQAATQGERLNTLGYRRQMLAKRLASAEDAPKDHCFIQYKLDGHRCSIINDGGKYVAYSKNGKLIKTIDHILENIVIPTGDTVDGELYHHGTPIQEIGSWVKKAQAGSKLLEFVCYDAMIPEMSFAERFRFLNSDVIFGSGSRMLETDYVIGEFDVLPLLRKALKNGYEGLMIRDPAEKYQCGVRSSSILKVKRAIDDGFVIDDEFLVVNIFRSADGWARLQCVTEGGKKFMASCHGDVEYKTHVLNNKKDFIGRHVKCEFAEYTKDKKPFHAIATMWREKHDE